MTTPDPARELAESSLREASAQVQHLSRTPGSDPGPATAAVARARAAVDAFSSKDAWVMSKLAADVYRLEGELRRARLLATADPLSAPPPNGNSERDARNRVLRSTNVLNQSNQYIENSTRLMHEARDTGESALAALNEQGRDLIQVHDQVIETQQDAKQARHVLRRMATRALYNRVFLWCVIVTLFVTDVLFLYYGFLKK